jgi:hypothetical protein
MYSYMNVNLKKDNSMAKYYSSRPWWKAVCTYKLKNVNKKQNNEHIQ